MNAAWVFFCVTSLGVAGSGVAERLAPALRHDGYYYREPRQIQIQTQRFARPDVTLDAPHAHPTGGDPPVVGVVRNLPASYATHASTTGPQTVVFRSIGAWRVRLHLTLAHLSEDLSVNGADGRSIPFGSEFLGADADIWTPSVRGDTIALTFGPGSRFVVSEIAHMFPPRSMSTSCFTDVSCNAFPDRDPLSRSIAAMTFIRGTSVLRCTGGLINSTVADRLFLTANHCISTQAEAMSLELDWDVRTTSCSTATLLPTLTTNGATLLVTSASTDVTLLRLGSLPPNRALMGWDTTRPAAGTVMYRISHPATDDGNIYSQAFSTTILNETIGGCAGLTRPAYLYSVRSLGGATHGSSGSPVIVQGGYIVGQLRGGCGADPDDGCSSSTSVVDGSFAVSFLLLQPYLQPTTTSCSCTPNANTACALGGRFKITLTWKDVGANLSGVGSLVRYADNLPEVDPQFGPVSESVFISLYSFAPKSVEVLVRVLNGHGINDKYWVFVTGFTGAEYTVTIQDTRTCANWQRTVPSGATTVIKDFNAFPLP